MVHILKEPTKQGSPAQKSLISTESLIMTWFFKPKISLIIMLIPLLAQICFDVVSLNLSLFVFSEFSVGFLSVVGCISLTVFVQDSDNKVFFQNLVTATFIITSVVGFLICLFRLDFLSLRMSRFNDIPGWVADFFLFYGGFSAMILEIHTKFEYDEIQYK